MKSRIVVILYPNCIFFEIALAVELLAKQYHIDYITPDGQEHLASNGLIIQPQSSYADVDLSNCRAILIPGGDPESIKDNKKIDEIIVSANQQEIYLAAICAGTSILAKAGVLKGKKIAHGYEKKQLEFLKDIFAGVTLADEKFVSDKNIITAKPEAHIDFAVELACRLNTVDAARANRTKDYYRGILGQKNYTDEIIEVLT
jgi:transcriptional regulator GlxA family with amidase domain